jgi:hypothetical protein
MSFELPLVKALAEIAIERDLKIKSRQTVWKEHLYELEGFKKLLPASLLDEVAKKCSRTLKPGELNINLEVGLRQRDPYVGLTEMGITSGEIADGNLIVALSSKDGTVEFLMGLDFQNEKLLYDPYSGMRAIDKGTKQSVEQIIGLMKFQRDLIGNGQLQIRLAGQRDIWGFTDAFIPMNIDPGRTAENFNKAIAEAEQELTKRSE